MLRLLVLTHLLLSSSSLLFPLSIVYVSIHTRTQFRVVGSIDVPRICLYDKKWL